MVGEWSVLSEIHLEGAEMPKRGETNIGAYWASRRALEEVLSQLHDSLYSEEEMRCNTGSGELGYPNEMGRGCLAAGHGVDGVPIADEVEMMGIKTPETLAAIREIVKRSIFRMMDRFDKQSRVVILTGAGISAESGIQTFRASDGLWENHRIEDVATPFAWQRILNWSGAFTRGAGDSCWRLSQMPHMKLWWNWNSILTSSC